MNELNIKDVLQDVEELTGAEFAPPSPLRPETACARIVGRPVTVHEIVEVNHLTIPLKWVRYTPYQQTDPWLLCPTVDLGYSFLAYLGAIQKGLQGWTETWDFDRYYRQGEQAISWFERWLANRAILTDDEQSWLIAVLRQWLADPREIGELVEQTKRVELPPEPPPPSPKNNIDLLTQFRDFCDQL